MILTEDQVTRISDDGLIHDAQRLKELQALPLYRKIGITQARIIEWYNHWNGNVYVSFSGGKDSTVLLHIVRSIFPDVPAVFSNTGLEYLEIQRFARSFPNLTVLTPKMRFDQVISTYGYPLISKEVAEAIYYARRIIPNDSSGGERNKTPIRKQKELLGLRVDTRKDSSNGENFSDFAGGENVKRLIGIIGDEHVL